MKECSSCKAIKPPVDFYIARRNKDGLQPFCKPCCSAKDAAYYKANKEKKKAISKAYYLANPGRTWATKLKRYYNITAKDYSQMFALQGGRCAGCQRHQSEFKRRLAVDHCHTTGKVRSLLCFSCNSLLGKFNEDFDLLKRVTQNLCGYLEKYGECA
jgi:hypothetical protein